MGSRIGDQGGEGAAISLRGLGRGVMRQAVCCLWVVGWDDGGEMRERSVRGENAQLAFKSPLGTCFRQHARI